MDNPVTSPEVSILTHMNKWVGVIIALVGAFIAAPDGARLIFQSTASAARDLVAKVRRSGAPQDVRAVTGSGSMTLGGLAMAATGRVWTPGASIDERIDALRKQVLEVEAKVAGIQADVLKERGERQEAIAELARTVHVKVDELHALLAEKDKQAARIDARGLPVVGAGIFLSGVPEYLAALPVWIAFPLPFLAFSFMIYVLTASLYGRRTNN